MTVINGNIEDLLKNVVCFSWLCQYWPLSVNQLQLQMLFLFARNLHRMLDSDVLENYCFSKRAAMTSEVKKVLVGCISLILWMGCDHRFRSKYRSSSWILSSHHFFNILQTPCFFCFFYRGMSKFLVWSSTAHQNEWYCQQ